MLCRNTALPKKRLASIAIGFAIVLTAMRAQETAAQQRISFPTPYAADPYTGMTAPGIITSGTSPGASPWVPVPGAPGAALNGQISPFDPYSLPSQALPPVYGGLPNTPPAVPQVLPPIGVPNGGQGGGIPRVVVPSYPGYPAPGGFPRPTAPSTAQPGGNIYGPDWGYTDSSPLFPEGMPWNTNSYQRLFQDTGARYTYLWGDDEDDHLEIHEVELSTSLVFQNFARSATGLRLTPGFVFDFLDGPNAGSAADLPAQLYSAYLDAAWRPQITPQFAADLRVRPGVYSDFQSVTGHSLRITGHGVGVVQLTPTTAFKLGVEYFDRIKVKLLPAAGIYWEPNPQTRVDLYFPRPKIARYWGTFGNKEVWWHIGAEYGGGSWVIDRVDAPSLGRSERIDINDIRVFAGIDWSHLDLRTGFLQLGYVFDREVVYKLVPSETLSLDDTFMIRAGWRF